MVATRFHFVVLHERPSPLDELLLSVEDAPPRLTWRRKWNLVKRTAIPFMVPLFVVYLAEYFINQGLLELIYFTKFVLSHDSQYRWLQVIYQLGVFVSRSSILLFRIRHIYFLSFCQVVNVVIFMLQAVFGYLPNFYVVVTLVLFEGLLGGLTYVNAFFRLRCEMEPKEEEEFALSVTSCADTCGIAVAGALAIPTHTWLCGVPLP
ncbi:unnamed protein product [Notodromas monacha]|uniref:Battenin n=1 Tax=Notodromas monacha TaxID=399045 RepID=A0A7R9BFF9_9CRUS|nr:unnamed protein product [Notodromas monacha]CAG0914428.1 unnamed protein product [Notodromas monacha]